MSDLDIDQDFLDGIDLNSLWLQVDAEECERSLYTYLQRAWSSFDPASFQGGSHIQAIAEHLEAVSAGEIRRLLVTIPPRHGKTGLSSVAWPTWTWAKRAMTDYPLIGPGVQFLCVSYGSDKAQEDAVTARRLISSPWYQERWGETSEVKRVLIAKDRDNQERYDTTASGSRISVGIGAAILGRGGNIKIIDDAHKPEEVESEVTRRSVIRAYDETLSSRENDPNIAAEVIIMQRLHDDDLAGHVLSKFGTDDSHGGFVHLCLPARYERERHCVTAIGWEDPRTIEGEPLWPERMPESILRQRETAEGPFSWSAKYQQSPVPRGGGIIKPEWWQVWPPQGEEFDEKGRPVKPLAYPQMDYIIATLDTALTEKKENDPSGMTVWGTWRSAWESKAKRVDFTGARLEEQEDEFLTEDAPRIMLMSAWDNHLAIHDLVKKVIETCVRRNVDRLLIEASSAGFSVAQEIARLCKGYKFGVSLQKPKGDKDARLHSVAHVFAGGFVYAPNRKWAQKVIDQCSAGSKGAHDEYADNTSCAIQHLRKIGEAPTLREYADDAREQMNYHREPAPYEDIV